MMYLLIIAAAHGYGVNPKTETYPNKAVCIEVARTINDMTHIKDNAQCVRLVK